MERAALSWDDVDALAAEIVAAGVRAKLRTMDVGDLSADDLALFEALREWRRTWCRAHDIKAAYTHPGKYDRRSGVDAAKKTAAAALVKTDENPDGVDSSKMFTDYLKRADLICAIGSSLTRTPFGPGVPGGKAETERTSCELARHG